MRRFLIIAIMLFSALAADADVRSSEVLGKMAAAIKAMKSYRVDFTLYADRTAKGVKGSYTVSGESYRVEAGGAEVFSDGKVRYEVNPVDMEVAIDEVNPSDNTIMGNPVRVFDFPADTFYHTYGDAAVVDGRAVDIVNVFPRGEASGVVQITLRIDASTRLPVQISYRLEGVSSPVKVDIDSVKPVSGNVEQLFRFDRSKYKSYEIIDFR